MSESSSSSNSGGGFISGLTIAFVVLKLCHVLDWSWVWVLSPIWISCLLLIAVLMVIAIISLTLGFMDRGNK